MKTTGEKMGNHTHLNASKRFRESWEKKILKWHWGEDLLDYVRGRSSRGEGVDINDIW